MMNGTVAKHFQLQFSEKKQGLHAHQKILYLKKMYYGGFILVQKLWLYISAEEQDFSYFIFVVEAFEKFEYSKKFQYQEKPLS